MEINTSQIGQKYLQMEDRSQYTLDTDKAMHFMRFAIECATFDRLKKKERLHLLYTYFGIADAQYYANKFINKNAHYENDILGFYGVGADSDTKKKIRKMLSSEKNIFALDEFRCEKVVQVMFNHNIAYEFGTDNYGFFKKNKLSDYGNVICWVKFFEKLKENREIGRAHV